MIVETVTRPTQSTFHFQLLIQQQMPNNQTWQITNLTNMVDL